MLVLARKLSYRNSSLLPTSQNNFKFMFKQKKVTPDRLMQFAFGYAPGLIIHAAVEHGFFDALSKGPKTATELVKATGASLRGVIAIADALVGLEFFGRAGSKYTLTPESAAFLVSTSPAYHGAFFKHMSSQLLQSWMQLPNIVRTGKPATRVNRQKGGAEFFAEFVESLFPLSYAAARTLGEHLKISKAKTPVSVLDLAAGSGVWGIGLAQQSPKVQITAVDWPAVLKVTARVAKKHGVGKQLKTVAGDLLQADFGANHQVATLGHILHSEGVERSRKLLRKTFDALAPGGTIAIMEFVPNEERTGPPMPLIFAVNMLVNTTEGDVFTFGEISKWLKEAGFKNPRLLPVPAVSPLILATRP